MIDALAEHRALAALGGWSSLGLEGRLQLSGDLDGEIELDEALARFQERHGLDPSGRVDTPTQRALRVSVERRIQLLLLNIERRRAMPELESRAVVVNVAGASLSLFEPGAEELTMRVIVGRHDHKTPLFSSRITG